MIDREKLIQEALKWKIEVRDGSLQTAEAMADFTQHHLKKLPESLETETKPSEAWPTGKLMDKIQCARTASDILNHSIKSGDPTLTDQVIKDLYRQGEDLLIIINEAIEMLPNLTQ